MNLSDYKELNMIFHAEPLKIWREKTLPMKNIPDNELTYVIFDGLLKSGHGKMDLLSALKNAIQFTSIADHPLYRTQKSFVLLWLIRGTELYKSRIDEQLPMFSSIKNIYTVTDVKRNYIMVNICGDRAKVCDKIRHNSVSGTYQENQGETTIGEDIILPMWR